MDRHLAGTPERQRGPLRSIRDSSIPGLFLLVALASLGAIASAVVAPAAPASADCTRLSPWPSFRAIADSATEVLIGTVTDSALPGGFASRFTLTVDDVLRGQSDESTIEFDRFHSGAPEPICPDGSVLRVRPGDRLAIARNARLPGHSRRVTAVAFVRPSEPDGQLLPKMERLSERQIRRIVGAPTAGDRAVAPSIGPPTPGATVDPRDCRGEMPDVAGGRDVSPTEVARLCSEARLRDLMPPVLDYAQAQIDYAGMIFDGDTARFWFTTDQTGHLDRIAALAPAGVAIDVRAATLTLTELASIQRSITADLGDLLAGGIPVETVGSDPARNSVIVGLKVATDGSQETLQRRYGPHVMTEVVGPISEDEDS